MDNTKINTSLKNTGSTGVIYENTSLAENILNGNISVRGNMGSVYAEEAELNRRMMKARMQNPEYYAYSDEISRDTSNRYRTGNGENGSYMTVDDYIRFCYDKQMSKKTHSTAASGVKAVSDGMYESRPAHPYSCVKLRTANNSLVGREAVYMGERETEMKVSPYRAEKRGMLQYLGQKYVGNEKVVNAGINPRHASGTIASVAIVILLAVSFILPIVLRVMIFNERNTIENLNSEMKSEEAEIVQLKSKIDVKNSEADIERLAIEVYDMTSLDESSYDVISLNPENIIEKAENSEKKSVALPALLNALGIRIQNSD